MANQIAEEGKPAGYDGHTEPFAQVDQVLLVGSLQSGQGHLGSAGPPERTACPSSAPAGRSSVSSLSQPPGREPLAQAHFDLPLEVRCERGVPGGSFWEKSKHPVLPSTLKSGTKLSKSAFRQGSCPARHWVSWQQGISQHSRQICSSVLRTWEPKSPS